MTTKPDWLSDDPFFRSLVSKTVSAERKGGVIILTPEQARALIEVVAAHSKRQGGLAYIQSRFRPLGQSFSGAC